MASTKNGSSSVWRTPAIVTECSCIASAARSVSWRARLISSAKHDLPEDGRVKLEATPGVALSPITSTLVPVISLGMRSGVTGCARTQIQAADKVRTSTSYPGQVPSSSTCPPAIKPHRTCSTTSRWPTTRCRRPHQSRPRVWRSQSRLERFSCDRGCSKVIGSKPGLRNRPRATARVTPDVLAVFFGDSDCSTHQFPRARRCPGCRCPAGWRYRQGARRPTQGGGVHGAHALRCTWLWSISGA